MENGTQRHSRILRLAAIGAVLLVTAFLYIPVFDAPFTFDDWDYIIENPAIGDLSRLAAIGIPKAGETSGNLELAARTRFLPLASFTFTYRAFGLNPRPFHLGNIALHLINIAVVYLLTASVLRTPRLAPSFGARADQVAWGAALLFAFHPVQTEAVAYISQRFTLMGTLWYAMAVLLYLQYRTSKGRTRGILLYCGSFVSAALGMISKEFCFTIPLMIALLEVALFTDPADRLGGSGTLRGRLLRIVPLFLTSFIIPLAHIDFSHPLAGAIEAASHIDISLPRWKYLIVEQRVHMTFLRLLLLPINQTLDYDYRPTGPGFVAGMFASALVIATALVWAARTAIGRKRTAGQALAALAILWYWLAIAVESTLVPLGDIIFEHRLYLPLIMPAAAVAALTDHALRRMPGKAWRMALGCGLALLAALLMTATFARATVWSTELSLTRDTARKAPRKSRTHNNYGLALEAVGRKREAIEEYRMAVALDATNMKAHGNLAEIELFLGMYESSLAEYEFLQKEFPNDPRIASRIQRLRAILGERAHEKAGETPGARPGEGIP